MQIDWSKVRCVVFDYGDTLCSDPYFRELGADFLQVVNTQIFGESSPEWADRWLRGELAAEDIVARLSSLTGRSTAEIMAGLRLGCSRIRPFPAIWQFAQTQHGFGRKTALVTLNYDIFSRVIVPAVGFDRVFDVIVNSSDYRTDDKVAMWEIAFRRLDDCAFENSLLFDDKLKHVERFRARGGQAYQFTGDAQFADWLANQEVAV